MPLLSIDRWRHRMSMRLRSLFRGAALDRELDEELQYHLERAIESNLARGLPRDAARREALLGIGGVEQRKEQCRDQRKTGLVDDLVRDVRYAARSLRRTPAVTLAALATLALGSGAAIAMFTVLHGVLLKPLPFPDPDRLFLVAMSPRGPFMRQPALSDHNYLAFRAVDRTFEHLAAYSTYDGNLIDGGDPAVIAVTGVTGEFFPALGVPPAAGRALTAEDAQDGREPSVVLSDGLWRSRFGADHGVLGTRITIDGVARLVVGVMPPGFDFPAQAQAWTPKIVALDPGNSLMFPVFGRLQPGVTLADARARFDAVAPQLPHPPPEDRASWQIGLLPLKEIVLGEVRRPLLVLSCAVVFVLLIACANVANLLLARAAGRQREMAVRAALGATRRRLVRQLFTEGAVLATLGGALGLLGAWWAVPAILALAPEGHVPRLEMIRIDRWVVGFAIGASLVTGTLFGLGPAVHVTRGGARSLLPVNRTSGAGHERVRAALVIGEIALALILLTGAGLMVKSFLRLRAVNPGFSTHNVLAVNLDLPSPGYDSAGRVHAFHQGLLSRLQALPDVVAAGAVNWRPLGNMHLAGDFSIEGRAPGPDVDVDKPAVSDGYFRAMGIRLLRGRDFSASDNASALPVAIVSRSVARLIEPAGDAVGARVTLETRPRPEDWLTVVGVVEDVRPLGPALGSHPAIYQPYLQVQRLGRLTHVSYVVRTTSDPVRAVPAIRTALRAVDRNQPARSIVLMDDVLAASTAEPRFQARLLGAFAGLAVLLAVIGTYGLLAYAVAQRTHEIGVRVALGARPSAIVWMVIRRTMLLGAAGAALGTAGAWMTTRLLTRLLFETAPTDPAVFAGVTLAIFIAALVAGLVPARRATEVDPLVALRHE
jgi:predicted permease